MDLDDQDKKSITESLRESFREKFEGFTQPLRATNADTIKQSFSERLEQNKQKLALKEADEFIKRGVPTDLSREDLAANLRTDRRDTIKMLDQAAYDDLIKGRDPSIVKALFEDKGTKVLEKRGLSDFDANTREKLWSSGVAELDKDQGKNLNTFSIKEGYTANKKQLDKASMGARAKFLGQHIVDTIPGLTEASRDVMAGQIGYLNAATKLQMSQSGFFGKLMLGAGTAGGGLFSLYMASESEDPLNEFMSSTAAAYSAQSFYRVGKAAGGLLGNSHVARLGLGGLAGGTAGVLTYFAGKTLGDLTSNESVAVSAMKDLASKEAFHFTQDTRVTATMRQRAMQKLSSSAMNSRGQLLGNEAMILRGAPTG